VIARKPLDHRRALQLLSSAQVFCPAIVPGLGSGGYYVFSAMKVLGHGGTIDAALADAQASGKMPEIVLRRPFRAQGKTVIRADEVLITCANSTLASRVANALNLYNPNERGIWMIVRFVLVAYCVGALLGALSLVEWLVSRIARVWVGFLAAGLLSCLFGAVGSLAVRTWRRFAR
jgi:hypothetical protein